MCALKERYDVIHVGSTIPHRSTRLDNIEAILHELAHAVCFGDLNLAPKVGPRIQRLAMKQQAVHEFTALRVELLVYVQLGRPYSTWKQKKLFREAEIGGAHTFAELQAPPTIAEQALATLLTGLIKRAASSLELI
jgi:hypothetical protein